MARWPRRGRGGWGGLAEPLGGKVHEAALRAPEAQSRLCAPVTSTRSRAWTKARDGTGSRLEATLLGTLVRPRGCHGTGEGSHLTVTMRCTENFTERGDRGPLPPGTGGDAAAAARGGGGGAAPARCVRSAPVPRPRGHTPAPPAAGTRARAHAAREARSLRVLTHRPSVPDLPTTRPPAESGGAWHGCRAPTEPHAGSLSGRPCGRRSVRTQETDPPLKRGHVARLETGVQAPSRDGERGQAVVAGEETRVRAAAEGGVTGPHGNCPVVRAGLKSSATPRRGSGTPRPRHAGVRGQLRGRRHQLPSPTPRRQRPLRGPA